MLLVHGDALDLGQVVAPHSVDLAYLDPPFAVGVPFGARTKKNETRAQFGAQKGPVAYDDRWPSREAYFSWLEARLRVVHGLLTDSGTLWLHLDHRTIHEAKALCDQLFGKTSFWGEVIWIPGNGARTRNRPGITHQTLLLYRRGKTPIWNAHDPDLREPYAATSLSMHFNQRDDEGRTYRERVIRDKAYRYYADEGRSLGSVWADCPAMVANTPLQTESTGYPTQKPRKLLERIVRASSREGSIVLDPFCGSGTTLEAAAHLGRKFIGSDRGALAIATTARRLQDQGIAFKACTLDSPARANGA